MRPKIKSYRDVLVLMALIGGTVLSGIGFTLYFTDYGKPLIYESIGIAVFLCLGILFWFGLGLAGILRMVGIALIASGLFGICMNSKPIPGIICLLIGIACRFAAYWMTRDTKESDSQKV